MDLTFLCVRYVTIQFNFDLQNFARKTKFPIDTISWDFEVVPGITDDAPKSEDGTYIRGLYIEGARFDSDAILMAETLTGSPQESVNHLDWDRLSEIIMSDAKEIWSIKS
jgi:hypothetical protein